jgi:hypothetical protein
MLVDPRPRRVPSIGPGQYEVTGSLGDKSQKLSSNFQGTKRVISFLEGKKGPGPASYSTQPSEFD